MRYTLVCLGKTLQDNEKFHSLVSLQKKRVAIMVVRSLQKTLQAC